jgi:hypothetical protein
LEKNLVLQKEKQYQKVYHWKNWYVQSIIPEKKWMWTEIGWISVRQANLEGDACKSGTV